MSADKAADTAAVLDEMVAGIMGTKQEKATRLTPVGLEGVKQRLPRTNAPFPNDDPHEVAEQALATLDTVIDHLTQAATALRDLVGQGSTVAAPILTQVSATLRADKAVEDAADESFTKRLERLAVEAQEAVYGKGKALSLADLDDDTAEETPSAPPPDEWVCPNHGGDTVTEQVSPRGRKYRACGVETCKEFER